MNEPWKIKSRSTVCAETGRQFKEGEHFYTALFELEDEEGFERKDFAEEAWDKVGESLEPYSFWRTKFEAPPPPPEKDVVKKENAESLLRRLIEEDQSSTENARYILAVMLERKKIFVQIETKSTKRGGKHLIYERHKTGEVFIVKDPQLKLAEIETVQEEVSALLGGPAKKEEKAEAEGETEEAEGDDSGETEEEAEAPAGEETAGAEKAEVS